jgi:hypothetical protein
VACLIYQGLFATSCHSILFNKQGFTMWRLTWHALSVRPYEKVGKVGKDGKIKKGRGKGKAGPGRYCSTCP